MTARHDFEHQTIVGYSKATLVLLYGGFGGGGLALGYFLPRIAAWVVQLPWFPFQGQYRRWVPDLPEIPPAAHALFKAREKALQGKDQADAADLRGELAKLGYVVRDEETRQYSRQVSPPGTKSE